MGPPAQPNPSTVLYPPAATPGVTDDERRMIAEMMAKGTYASINLATRDLDGTFERLQATDAEVVQEPTDQPYGIDRKSTRLNSSHANISYAVFCLKKKNNHYIIFVFLMIRRPPRSTLFPTRRSSDLPGVTDDERRMIAEMMAKGTYASINLATRDLDGTFERLQATDAEVVQEPTDQPYGIQIGRASCRERV